MARLGEPFMQRTKLSLSPELCASKITPDATILSELSRDSTQFLRAQKCKDIWLFGGGELFRSLLDLKLVDTVEVAVIPVLLGSGIPLLPAGRSHTLKLLSHNTLPNGICQLTYSITEENRP